MTPDEIAQAYFHAKFTALEFEAKESLRARDFQRVRAIFLDLGRLIERYPSIARLP